MHAHLRPLQLLVPLKLCSEYLIGLDTFGISRETFLWWPKELHAWKHQVWALILIAGSGK